MAIHLALSLWLALTASAATKNILVTGYWPPTNHMLVELSPHAGPFWKGRNWRGLGYDVYAYYPTNTEGTHGIGQGDFRVDFAAVYNDFHRLTNELKPVAILHFGAGDGPWEIEAVYPAYFSDWFSSGRIPSEIGVEIQYPIPLSLRAQVERASTLPMREIESAVNALGAQGLPAWIDARGGAGDYVCGFTGYMASWYQAEHASPTDPAHVKAAGFIHVNGELPQAQAAMEASLEALARWLGRP